jgi:hypothetical protein
MCASTAHDVVTIGVIRRTAPQAAACIAPVKESKQAMDPTVDACSEHQVCHVPRRVPSLECSTTETQSGLSEAMCGGWVLRCPCRRFAEAPTHVGDFEDVGERDVAIRPRRLPSHEHTFCTAASASPPGTRTARPRRYTLRQGQEPVVAAPTAGDRGSPLALGVVARDRCREAQEVAGAGRRRCQTRGATQAIATPHRDVIQPINRVHSLRSAHHVD